MAQKYTVTAELVSCFDKQRQRSYQAWVIYVDDGQSGPVSYRPWGEFNSHGAAVSKGKANVKKILSGGVR